METRPYVQWELINNFMIDVFKAYGVPEEDAKICADVLLESDRRGIESHGCNRFKPIYLDRIKNGTLLPKTECEIVKEGPCTVLMDAHNGMGMVAAHEMMEKLIEKAKKFGFKIIAFRDLIAYRLKQESLVEKGVEVDMPTEYGHFRLIPFRQKSNGLEHIAIIKGEINPDEAVLVRVHSSCMTGDIFGSKRCDCGDQLHKALQMIEKEGKGAVVYLNQEGRGIGLMEKMKAYKLQENGMDTVDANLCLGHKADERDYGVGAEILRAIGVSKMRLITNNPVKRVGLESYGLSVEENVSIEITPNEYNERYLQTKKERMGHTLNFNDK